MSGKGRWPTWRLGWARGHWQGHPWNSSAKMRPAAAEQLIGLASRGLREGFSPELLVRVESSAGSCHLSGDVLLGLEGGITAESLDGNNDVALALDSLLASLPHRKRVFAERSGALALLRSAR